jgi:hypothetical protein
MPVTGMPMASAAVTATVAQVVVHLAVTSWMVPP